jgi:hypothetical protein
MSQPKPNLRRDMGTLPNDDLLAAIPKATKDELSNTAVALVNELIRRGFHPENTPVVVIRTLESITGKGTFRHTWEAAVRSKRFSTTPRPSKDDLLGKSALGRAALQREEK